MSGVYLLPTDDEAPTRPVGGPVPKGFSETLMTGTSEGRQVLVRKVSNRSPKEAVKMVGLSVAAILGVQLVGRLLFGSRNDGDEDEFYDEDDQFEDVNELYKQAMAAEFESEPPPGRSPVTVPPALLPPDFVSPVTSKRFGSGRSDQSSSLVDPRAHAETEIEELLQDAPDHVRDRRKSSDPFRGRQAAAESMALAAQDWVVGDEALEGSGASHTTDANRPRNAAGPVPPLKKMNSGLSNGSKLGGGSPILRQPSKVRFLDEHELTRGEALALIMAEDPTGFEATVPPEAEETYSLFKTCTLAAHTPAVGKILVVTDRERIAEEVRGFKAESLVLSFRSDDLVGRAQQALEAVRPNLGPSPPDFVLVICGSRLYMTDEDPGRLLEAMKEPVPSSATIKGPYGAAVLVQADVTGGASVASTARVKMTIDVSDRVLWASRNIVPQSASGKPVPGVPYLLQCPAMCIRTAHLEQYGKHPPAITTVSEGLEVNLLSLTGTTVRAVLTGSGADKSPPVITEIHAMTAAAPPKAPSPAPPPAEAAPTKPVDIVAPVISETAPTTSTEAPVERPGEGELPPSGAAAREAEDPHGAPFEVLDASGKSFSRKSSHDLRGLARAQRKSITVLRNRTSSEVEEKKANDAIDASFPMSSVAAPSAPSVLSADAAESFFVGAPARELPEPSLASIAEEPAPPTTMPTDRAQSGAHSRQPSLADLQSPGDQSPGDPSPLLASLSLPGPSSPALEPPAAIPAAMPEALDTARSNSPPSRDRSPTGSRPGSPSGDAFDRKSGNGSGTPRDRRPSRPSPLSSTYVNPDIHARGAADTPPPPPAAAPRELPRPVAPAAEPARAPMPAAPPVPASAGKPATDWRGLPIVEPAPGAAAAAGPIAADDEVIRAKEARLRLLEQQVKSLMSVPSYVGGGSRTPLQSQGSLTLPVVPDAPVPAAAAPLTMSTWPMPQQGQTPLPPPGTLSGGFKMGGQRQAVPETLNNY